MMYKFMVPDRYLDKMQRIKEKTNISIAKQIKIGIEEYLFKHEMAESLSLKSLSDRNLPKISEVLFTEKGKAEVIAVRNYEYVHDELELNGFSKKDIDDFTARIEHFLGNKEIYFECDIRLEDGQLNRIDWSEYRAAKKRAR